MKRVFVLFIMMFAVMMSARAERTVIFEGDSYAHPAVIPLPLIHEGVTFSIYGSVHTDGLLMYGDRQSSISTEVGVITSIVFEGQGSVTFSFSEGSYYVNGYNGFWSGKASSVTFVPSASLVVRRVIVTVDDSDAISDLSLCDLQSLQGNESFVSSRELVVLRQARTYLYVKDRSADCYGLISGVEQTYAQGDVIPSGWGGRMMIYTGEPRLMSTFGFKPAVENVDVIAEEITPGDVGHDYWAHYVVLKNVMISEDGSKLIDEDGNEALVYKWMYGIEPPELPDDLSVPYDVYGIVDSFNASYNSSEIVYMLLPMRYERTNTPETVCCLEDLFELYPQHQPVEFFCPLTVIYQSGYYLYFKDECGRFGLMSGNQVGGPFMNGDTIVGTAYWISYYNVPQLGTYAKWQLVGHGPAVHPVVSFIEEMSADQLHSYVRFEGVKIITGEYGQKYIEDESGNRMPIYDRFNVSLPTPERVYPPCYWSGEITIADVNFLIDVIISHTGMIDWDGTYDMNGFIEVYYGTVEFTPTEIIFHGDAKDYSVCDLNNDGEINIADVNDLINIILW